MRLTRLLGLDTLRGVLRFYSIVLVSLPLLLAAVFFSLFQRGQVISAETALLAEALRQEANVVRAWIDEQFDDVSFLAGLGTVVRDDRPGMSFSFRAFVDTHPFVKSAVYVAPDGLTAADSAPPVGIYVGDRRYFQEALAGRKSLETGLVSRSSGRQIWIFAAPVRRPDQEAAGLVFLAVELASLDQWLQQTTFVVNREGVVLCDAEGRILAPTAAVAAGGGAGTARVPQGLLAVGGAGGLYRDPGGREMLGAAVPLGYKGWLVVRSVPAATVLAGYRRQTQWVAVGALTTILLVTPLLLRLCRRLEQPLLALARHARALQAGGYETGCSLVSPPGTLREVDDLYAAFCEMGRQVRGHIEEVERLSIQDALTGLHNRRFLFSGGAKLLYAAARANQACSCLMLDVDHFKRVNDIHGHQSGDQVLAQLAALFRDSVRRSDLVARYGGEEFAIVLAGAGLGAALELAERIRRRVEETPCRIEGGVSLPVTVSIGAAEVRELVEYGESPLEDMLARADKALYAAKAAGRNRVRGDAVETPG